MNTLQNLINKLALKTYPDDLQVRILVGPLLDL